MLNTSSLNEINKKKEKKGEWILIIHNLSTFYKLLYHSTCNETKSRKPITCWTGQVRVVVAAVQQRKAPRCPEQHQCWCWPK